MAQLLADPPLVRRCERADVLASSLYASTLSRLRPEVGAASLEVGGGAVVFAGATSPVTRARGLGVGVPVEGSDLDVVETFLRDRGAWPQVEACTLADLTLLDQLWRRGYKVRDFVHALVRPIGEGDRGLAGEGGPVELRRVDLEEAEAWVRVVTQGFHGKDDVTAEDMSIVAPMPHLPGGTCLLASIGGEAVGGGLVLVHERVALLSSTSTRAGHRGRGVHAALLRARLAHAADAGCDLALITTRPASQAQANVERQGFRVAYARVRFEAPGG